jgi:O-antigen/teichoic acid export membrane protein
MMTWLNLSSKMLSLVVVLPLVLNRFSEGDVAFYFLLISAMTFQMMTAGGFVASFSRYVSYALAGATLEDIGKARFVSDGVSGKGVSGEVVAKLRGTMRRVFGICALTSCLILGPVGTILIWKPVHLSSDVNESWLAWAVILLVTLLTLYGMRFNTFLQGANKIALEQRWSAAFSIFASLSGVFVLILGGGVLELVISNQFWLVVGYFRNGYLEKETLGQLEYEKKNDRYQPELLRVIWPPAWRSMIGILLSSGVTQASGFIYAQIFNPTVLASYLLGLRMISIISQVSNAPFYSKIPRFNRLRASGKILELKKAAYKSMTVAHVLFILGIVFVGAFAKELLEIINSETEYPELSLWTLLAIAFFLERYGAMHMQIYTTTNHVIWHIANGISGGITIILTLLLAAFIGVYAFPVAMIIGYLSYYSTVVPYKSKKSLTTSGTI